MRAVALAGSVFAMAVLAEPALAQASFMRVREAGSGVIYWDTASLKRTGDTIDVEVLRVFKAAPGKSLSGDIERHRLSCVWSASVGGVLGRRTINEAGRVLETSGAEPFSQASFYGPHGWQALLAPIACDPAKAPASGLTAAKAMADAKVQLAAQSESGAASKRAGAAPADSDPAQFGLIREEKSTGNMAFLDWSRMTRAGDKATVQTLDVLGDDTAPPPEPQWRYSVIALRELALDCKARTLSQTAYFTFTKYLQPGFPDGMTWPTRTAADWPLGAQILDAACSGKEPAKTFSSRAAAIAYQRSVHPLKK